MGIAQYNFGVDEIYCWKLFVRVADEIYYPMFLLLPLNLRSSDLNGMVWILLQSSGNPRSFHAAPEYAGR